MASADIPPPPATFSMTPDEAIAFFRAKGLKPTFTWQDMAAGEHAKAFTIAKMMDVDLLATVRQSLDDALVNGTPFEAWAKQIQPMLEAKGWWGKKDVIDPKTGKVVSAQLGSAARLETIFRTNLQSAYAAAHWEQITAQADVAPYLMYDAIDDARTRETHRAWDGTVLPVFSEWWRTHYPPCGWQCRCSAIQLSEDELEALGLEVSREPRTDLREWTNPRTGETELVPVGVDPGFGRTPTAGKKTPEQLLEEKIKALPQDLAASANLGIEAMNKQIAREVQQRVVKQAGAAALARAEASAAASAAAAEAEAQALAEAQAASADAVRALPARFGEPIEELKQVTETHRRFLDRARAELPIGPNGEHAGELPQDLLEEVSALQQTLGKALGIEPTTRINGVRGLEADVGPFVQGRVDGFTHDLDLKVRATDAQSAQQDVLVHELIHTMGGAAKDYQRLNIPLEEAATEELTQMCLGNVPRLTRPIARLDLDPDKQTEAYLKFNQHGDAFELDGTYVRWRNRLMTMLSGAMGNNDPEIVATRLRRAMLKWKSQDRGGRSGSDAVQSFIEALEPSGWEEEYFFNRVITDLKRWGPPQ